MALTPLRRVFIASVLTIVTAFASAGLVMGAPSDGSDLRTFITASYLHGVPYREARAFGPHAVPQLAAMLEDGAYEPHWFKVVFTLGAIGDPSAVGPLRSFLKRQRGELSLDQFRAVLAVPPALGVIAHGGDQAAFDALVRFTKLKGSKSEIRGGYRRYRGGAMKEVLGRVALQGLGLSGSNQASQVLAAMRADRHLRRDWRDNVDAADALVTRVQREGLDGILGGGHD